MGEKSNKQLHTGHRARMRKRFLCYGIHSLEPHEALEMLLYYAIPQKDTNPLAHRVLNQFGNLFDMMRADRNTLSTVEGMTPASSVLIDFLHQFYQRTMKEKLLNTVIVSPEHAANCFRSTVLFETEEQLWALFLDQFMNVRGFIPAALGSKSSVTADLKPIAEESAILHASTVMILHNHPDGSAQPSRSDVDATFHAASYLKKHGVDLVDHIIVSEKDYFSMRASGIFSAIQKI